MRHGGAIMVDSTAKGKSYPDSFSKTVPIWACVLNRLLARYRQQQHAEQEVRQEEQTAAEEGSQEGGWDEALHLPPWIPPSETAQIEALLPKWVEEASALGIDLDAFAGSTHPTHHTQAAPAAERIRCCRQASASHCGCSGPDLKAYSWTRIFCPRIEICPLRLCYASLPVVQRR